MINREIYVTEFNGVFRADTVRDAMILNQLTGKITFANTELSEIETMVSKHGFSLGQVLVTNGKQYRMRSN
jgi:hypothetical protein